MTATAGRCGGQTRGQGQTNLRLQDDRLLRLLQARAPPSSPLLVNQIQLWSASSSRARITGYYANIRKRLRLASVQGC